MFKLNFWQEPDWRRESTINPNFLMVVMVALCLIVAGWLVSSSYRLKNVTTDKLRNIRSEHAEVKDTAEKIQELRQLSSFWQSKQEELEDAKKRKLIMSRQLETLQSLVPPEIVLQSLRINLNIIENEDRGSGGKEGEEKLQYRLDLAGTAGGDNPQLVITDFAGRLRPGSDNIIGRSLKSYELKQISGRGGEEEGEKSFNVECVFQPR